MVKGDTINVFQATKIQKPLKKVRKNQNFQKLKNLTSKKVYTMVLTKYEVARTIELRYLEEKTFL